MASDWLSSAISGAAGLAGAAVNYFSQKEANETNLQLARENRDFYYQQWQRENAYNDPSAVMQRLAGAGLNPNLMYGEGTGGLAASATMQNTDPGRVVAPQVDPMMMAQIGLLSAQTRKTEAETDKVKSDIDVNRGIVKVNESTVLYNQALTSYTKAQQDKTVSEMELIASNIDEINARIPTYKASIDRMNQQSAIEWSNTFLKSKEIDALCEKYAAEVGWTKEQIKYYAAYIGSVISNNKSQASLNAAEKLLSDEQRDQVNVATSGLKISNDRARIQLQLDSDYADQERQLAIMKLGTEITKNMFDASNISVFGVTDVGEANLGHFKRYTKRYLKKTEGRTFGNFQ